MTATKIICLLFAAAVLNGATDGHSWTSDTATQSRAAAPVAPAKSAAPAAVVEASALPPLPSEADLRLDH